MKESHRTTAPLLVLLALVLFVILHLAYLGSDLHGLPAPLSGIWGVLIIPCAIYTAGCIVLARTMPSVPVRTR